VAPATEYCISGSLHSPKFVPYTKTSDMCIPFIAMGRFLSGFMRLFISYFVILIVGNIILAYG
jgi:hypothetical protein